jgi:cyclophilin family peptidyl-prolyl cis-trans isomerase
MSKQHRRSGNRRKATGSRRQMIRHPAAPAARPSSTRSRPHLWWYIGGGIAVALIAAGVVAWLLLGRQRGAMPSDPAKRANMYTTPPAMQIDPNRSYVATIVTGKGNIVVALNPQAAPQTVNNFVFLARSGFYDGLTFHRVEPGFVIQGGDPLGTGSGGPGYTLPAEIGLTHVEGAIAMARLPDSANPERNSSGSQFYITLAPTPFLDGAYTVFGQVTEGMDVVKAIEKGDIIETIVIEER